MENLSGKVLIRHYNPILTVLTIIFSAYCNSTSFKADKEVKEGHKKGLGHAMTLCIGQLRRRALKKAQANCDLVAPSASTTCTVSDDEDQSSDHEESDESNNFSDLNENVDEDEDEDEDL